jgi:hypothetical protein
MLVGLEAGGFDSGVEVSDGFDSFMLDETVSGPKITASISDGNINLIWPATGSFTLQSTLGLNPANWQPVTVTPVSAGGTDTVTLPATNTIMFFRLVQ